MKIATVVGARPQFIKAAVVSRAIDRVNELSGKAIKEVIIHTGQHYDANMSDVFFREMRIADPAYNLGISNCSHGAMTGRMLERIEDALVKEKPDVVLVYGDTNSTLAGALAAAKLHIPVAHVEAGLRSYNMKMPEEINRILTDRISHFLFCPTERAVRNLDSEGIRHAGFLSDDLPIVANAGDVMYDAMLFYREIASPSGYIQKLMHELNDNFYLATVHREENTDNADHLRNIIEAFCHISKRVPVVLPLHPRTRKLIAGYGLHANEVIVVDPVGYFDMLTLLTRCRAVFTDSGGLQKEAFFFHKPCVTLRNETEWVELVECGVNDVVGPDRAGIIEAERMLHRKKPDYSAALYGAGDAGDRIVEVLSQWPAGRTTTGAALSRTNPVLKAKK